MLLAHGAKPNRRDAQGRTALILAADYSDRSDVVHAPHQWTALTRRRLTTLGRELYPLSRWPVAIYGLHWRYYGPSTRLLRLRTSPQAAARLGLKTMQAAMAEFHELTSCVSCHHEGLGRIATASLRDHGFAVDNGVQKAEMEAVNAVMTAMEPLHEQALKSPEVMKQVPLIEINEVATTDTWLLAGMAAQKQPPTRGSCQRWRMVACQAADARWPLGLLRSPREPHAVELLHVHRAGCSAR